MDSTSNINNELDQYGVWVKTPPHNALAESTNETPSQNSPEDLFNDKIELPPLDPSVTEDESDSIFAGTKNQEVVFENITANSHTENNETVNENSAESEPVTVASDENSEEEKEIDVNFFSDNAESEDSGDVQLIPQIMEAPISDLADGDVSLDSFLSDSGDGEISVDSFFSDNPTTSDTNLQPDGDISLDAFLDASDFGLGSDSQENTSETFEDPLDIDLTFEDTVVEEDDGDDMDFDNLDSFFPESDSSSSSIDITEFTSDSSGDITDNFDAMFDSIEDSAPPKQESTNTKDIRGEFLGESESIDLSEFGLGDEDSGTITLERDDSKSKAPVVQDYDLSIDLDSIDSNDIGSEATEDNVEIDIDTTETDSGALKQDEENPFSAPDSDFDVDSLFDSIVDETGSTGTPLSGAKTEEEKSSLEETKAELPDIENFDIPNANDEVAVTQEQQVEDIPIPEASEAVENVDSELVPPVADETAEEAADFFESETAELNNEETTESSITETENSEDNAKDFTETTTEEIKLDEPAVTENEDNYELDIAQNEMEIEKDSDAESMPIPSLDENDTEDEAESLNMAGLENSFPDVNITNEIIESPEEDASENDKAQLEIHNETTEGSMADKETAEENVFDGAAYNNSDEEVRSVNSAESTDGNLLEENSIALDDFMGSEGFSDPSICEGNRSYSPEELAEQEKEKNEQSDETVDETPSSPSLDETYLVDAAEGGNSNDVIDDEDVIPSPFYSPLVETEGESLPDFQNSEIENQDDIDSEETGYGAFDLDADSIIPADMSGLSYDEDTGIRPAENSDETVAENENKGDNINSIVGEISSENTTPVEVSNSGTEGIKAEAAEENNIIPDAGEEQMDSTYTNDEVSETKSLISQIAKELSSLRQEINELKSEFAEIRNGKTANAAETEPADSEKESGFFSDMDDDDTIALSGDELSNILSSAEFTPADESHTEESLFGSVEGTATVPEQEYENNLNVDFDNEKLEEPNLDTVQLVDNSKPEDENLPSEIEVPKIDDVLVESASSDYMSSDNASDEIVIEPVENTDESEMEEPSLDSTANDSIENETSENEPADTETEVSESIEVEESVETDSETTESEENIETEEPEIETDSYIEETSEEESFEEPVVEPSDEESEISDSLDRQVDNSISQDDYNYLSEDENKDESAFSEEDEKLEAGISEEPVNTVFNNWDSSTPADEEDALVDSNVDEEYQEPVEATDSEEQEITSSEETENLVDPAVVDDDVPEESETDEITGESPAETVPSSVNSIPEEMKQEIKSVLAYMDQLLESLPEDKIAEFAQSEQFSTYKKLFTELGLS